MQHKLLILLLSMFLVGAADAQCPGPTSRIALINLQRATSVEDSRAGQVGLTDTCGNQRYAQYTEVRLDTIVYIPSSTGNTQNLSEFVIDPIGQLWYIDWQGNAVQFASGGGCDSDWLVIQDNACPDDLLDSIYKYRYASVGARYVWPGAEFLVNDSTASGIMVVQGSRNARLALYDSQAPGSFSMLDHGGSTPVFYMPPGANFTIKTTAGTPQTPIGSQVNHFAINAQDSTIQAFQYPRTRVDTQALVNFLYTDLVGKFRSRPVSDIISAGGGITGSGVSGRVAYWNGVTSITNNAIYTFSATGSSSTPHLRVRSSTTQFQPVYRADSLAADGIGFQARAFGTSGSAFSALTGTASAASGTQDISINLTNSSTNPAAYSFLSLNSSGGGSITKYNAGANTYFAGNDAGVFKINWTNVDAFSTSGINVSSTTSDVGIGAVNSTGQKFLVSGGVRLNLGSDATGDIFYRNGSGNFTRLGIGSPGDVLTVAAGLPSWAAPSGGSGTVTSVGLSLPAIFSVSGSPVTTSGTLTGTLVNQSANTVFAGPTSGGAAAPGFRALVAADIPASAAGDFFKDGGNSFGAAATLGTNDNNTLSLKTNNVTRATVTSGASTGGAWTFTDVTANTNTIEDVLTIRTNSTGTPANNYGSRLLFQLESSTTDNRDAADIRALWTTASDGTRTSDIRLFASNAATFQETARFTGGGTMSLGGGSTTYQNTLITTGTTFSIGNSANTLTLGNALGNVVVSCTGSSGNISIQETGNGAAATGNITVGGGTTFTQTSGTRNYMQFNYGFAPTSGTAIHNQFVMDGTFNQTGGANGITRALYLNQTLTAVADFRGLEIAYNSANAKGIYQTGASTTNNLVGATAFGSTSAPNTVVDVTGTTSTEHLIGQNLTPTIQVEADAGTGASASMTNAQSSDVAGRFSVTTGTGAAPGLWATVTFDDAFSTTPIVQIYCEDGDCSNLTTYVNVSTTGFELFINSGEIDGTTHEFNYIVIGGK